MNNKMGADDLPRKLRPRRPPLPAFPSSGLSAEAISRYLESVSYGEEDPSFQLKFSSLDQRHALSSSELPWNVLFRLWLLQQKSTTHNNANSDCFSASAVLPKILVSVRAEGLLFRDTFTADLMDVNTTDDMLRDTCWSRDCMLVFWVQHQRHLVIRDLKDHVRGKLQHSEQLCLLEIIRTIDEITRYKTPIGIQSLSTNSDSSSVPLELIKSFQKDQRANQDDEFATNQPKEEIQVELPNLSVFQTWISSDCEHSNDAFQSGTFLTKLYHVVGNEGAHGNTYQRVHESLSQLSQDHKSCAFLAAQIQMLAVVHQNDTDNLIRGKALVLHLLLSAGIGTSDFLADDVIRRQSWERECLSVSSSSPDAIMVAVQKYLTNQARQRGMPPNVNCLTVQLWNLLTSDNACHSSVAQAMLHFRDWLPVNVILSHYRTFLLEHLRVPTALEPDSRTLSKNLLEDMQKEQKLLQDLTSFVVQCCDGNTDWWRRNVLDENMIYQFMVPLHFHLCQLSCRATSASGHDKRALACAIRALGSFSGFVVGIVHAPDLVAAVPEVSALLSILSSLEGPIPPSGSEPQDFASVATRDLCESLRGLHTEMKAVIVVDRNPLRLAGVLDSLVVFCQVHQAGGVQDSEVMLTTLCQQTWNDNDLYHSWISRVLHHFHTPDCRPEASPFLERFHSYLMRRICDQPEVKMCFVEAILSEFEHAQAPNASERDLGRLREIAGLVLRMSPVQCVFVGPGQLDQLLSRSLQVFAKFDPHANTLRHLLVAAAVHLSMVPSSAEADGTKLTETWTRCVSRARACLLPIARSCPPNTFLVWYNQVSSELESLPSSSKKAIRWWREVALDLSTCCKHQADRMDIASGDPALHLASSELLPPDQRLSRANGKKRPAPSDGDQRATATTGVAGWGGPSRRRQVGQQNTNHVFPSSLLPSQPPSATRIHTDEEIPSNDNDFFHNGGGDDDDDDDDSLESEQGSGESDDEILLLDL